MTASMEEWSQGNEDVQICLEVIQEEKMASRISVEHVRPLQLVRADFRLCRAMSLYKLKKKSGQEEQRVEDETYCGTEMLGVYCSKVMEISNK